MLNVPDVGSKQISAELDKFEQRLQDIDVRSQQLINPSKIVDVILAIPKWLKAAFYIICALTGMTLILMIKRIVDAIIKLCKTKRTPKRTVAISGEPPALIRTRSIMSIPSRRNSHVSIVETPVNEQAQYGDQYMEMYPQLPVSGQTVAATAPVFCTQVPVSV